MKEKKIYRIISWLMLLVCLLSKQTSIAQEELPKQQTLGACISYELNGNSVVFNCTNDARVLLQLCSSEVLKVWISPTGTFKRENESFAVINERLGDVAISVNEEATVYEIFTGPLRIRVNKNPFKLQIFDKYQKLLLGDYDDSGFVKQGTRVSAFKALRNDEQFFGLGEKAGTFNRRGNTYKMWNSDQPCYGETQDPLYKSIPFFMSSYHYGIFFDNTYKTEFKLGSESDQYFSFEAPAGEMIYYFMYGNDYKQIIKHYINLTGKPIMPPKWALGFSQSRGLYVKEDQAREIAEEFRKRKIPCDIIYQDIGWVEGLQNFDWKKNNYNNPKQLLSDLDDKGFKMIVSQDPVISQANGNQWREADSLHYLVQDVRTGKPYDMPWPWGGNCGVVDFTKPGVADWWGSYQQKPIDDGVRGFWTDMGEPAWSNEDATDRLYMKHHAGMHDEIHNVYGLTWDKVVTEQFNKRNPNKRIFQMTRAAYAGLQRYTFGWSGDSGNGNNVLEGWSQFANQIPISLSAGLGLIPFWACDISGYCGDIKDYSEMAELYTRWLQFGVFNPLSRAHHEGDNAVEPWAFGEATEKIAREAIELKYQLFPYIYTYAREAYDTGLPLMRPLMLEYPNDKVTFDLNDQFLFGKELLVAPVVEKGALTKKVYLPEGEWIDFNDKKTLYKGKQWITVDAPLDKIPLFVKSGSIIPMMPIMQYIHEVQSYPVYLDVFPAQEGKNAEFNLYEDEGENLGYQKEVFARTTVSCSTMSNGYMIQIEKKEEGGYRLPEDRNLVFRIHTKQSPKKVHIAGTKIKKVNTNKLDEKSEVDSPLWSWNKESGICTIKLRDTKESSKVAISIM